MKRGLLRWLHRLHAPGLLVLLVACAVAGGAGFLASNVADVIKSLRSPVAACLPRLPSRFSCCSVLWLLRFPPYGEQNIRMQAASQGVDPCRIIFTGE